MLVKFQTPLILFLLLALVIADMDIDFGSMICDGLEALSGVEGVSIGCSLAGSLIKFYGKSLKGSNKVGNIIKGGTCHNIYITRNDRYEICTTGNTFLFYESRDIQQDSYRRNGDIRCYSIRNKCANVMPGVGCVGNDFEFCAGKQGTKATTVTYNTDDRWGSCTLEAMMLSTECNLATTSYNRCRYLEDATNKFCDKDYKWW